MNSNNNIHPELVIAFAVLAVIVAVLQFIAIVALIGAVMVTVGLTILSLVAWNKPTTIFGEVTTPDEARGFIARGVIGAFLGFVGAQLYDVFNPISENVMGFVTFAGYFTGSVLIGIALEEYAKEQAEAEAARKATQILPPPPPAQHVPQQQEAFRFASWDDEELR